MRKQEKVNKQAWLTVNNQTQSLEGKRENVFQKSKKVKQEKISRQKVIKEQETPKINVFYLKNRVAQSLRSANAYKEDKYNKTLDKSEIAEIRKIEKQKTKTRLDQRVEKDKRLKRNNLSVDRKIINLKNLKKISKLGKKGLIAKKLTKLKQTTELSELIWIIRMKKLI